MNIRVPLPDMSSNQRRNEDHNTARRHGNAASDGADDFQWDLGSDTRRAGGSLRLPERSSSSSGSTSTRRTVEELRAHLREGTALHGSARTGNAVYRKGRHLTDFDLDEQKERQRMPEPMPTSWLSPVKPEPPSVLMRHLTSGLLGLTIGLAVTVPAVLWHKGRIDPVAVLGWTPSDFGLAVAAPASMTRSKERETLPAVPGMIISEATPRAVASVEVIRSAPSAPVAVLDSSTSDNPSAGTTAVLQPAAVESASVQQEPPRAVVLLDEARRLIGEGDFPAARQRLQDRELATVAEARFLLAETYDPNFLAARGIRSVRAEVPRAVELYKEALDGGMDAARQRLAGLRP